MDNEGRFFLKVVTDGRIHMSQIIRKNLRAYRNKKEKRDRPQGLPPKTVLILIL